MTLTEKYYIFEIHHEMTATGSAVTFKAAKLPFGHPDAFDSEEEAVTAIETLPGEYLEFVVQKTYSRQRRA